MPRIRTIKPEFWDSPDMRGCDPWARLLFIALWQWADDHGRGTANVRELAAFAFPDELDPLVPTAKELPSLLKEIRGRFGVVFYEVRGRRYYFVPSFDRHQRTERKAKSRYPAPDEGTVYDPDPSGLRESEQPTAAKEVPSHSEGSSAALVGRSGTGTGEQGNRGTGEVPTTSGREAPATADTLIAEWIEHCRKRPPGNVIGQVGKQLKAMLTEGIDPADVRRGLAAWAQKGIHPSTLPSVVNEVMNAPAGNVVALRKGDPRPSRTDVEVSATLALAEELESR